MSGTNISTGPLGTVLNALEVQQSRLPEPERGLGKELGELQSRLSANPQLEYSARFTTEVAWLVQDWKSLSGTGEDPHVAPVLLPGLQNAASALPGLENEEIKELLAKTGELEDRGLVHEIRQQALDMAERTPEQQASIAAARIAAVLVYRVDQAISATGRAPEPVQPQPEVGARGSTPSVSPSATEVGAEEPVEAGAMPTPPDDPRGPDRAAAETPVDRESAPQPSRSNEAPGHDTMEQRPDVDSALHGETIDAHVPDHDPFDNLDDPAYQASLEQEAARGRDSEHDFGADPQDPGFDPDIELEEPEGAAERDEQTRATDQERASDAEQAEPEAFTSAQAQPGKASPQAAPGRPEAPPKPAATQGVAAPAAAAGVAGGLRSALGSYMSGVQEKADRRRIDTRVRKVRDAAKEVDEDLGALKKAGREFFEAFDKAVSQDGNSSASVISGMADGGPHADLRGKLNESLEKNPGFAASWEKLRRSSARLGQEVGHLGTEASRMDATADPVVTGAEETAAKVGKKLESLPGREDGNDFLKEVGAALERLVDRFHDFFTRDRKKEQTRDNGPSPEA